MIELQLSLALRTQNIIFYGVVAVHPSIPILFQYLEMYFLESMDAY